MPRPELRHPFDSLGPRTLTTAVWWFAAAFGLLSAALFLSIPAEELSRIQELVATSSQADARALLQGWPASTLGAFSFLLGFDLLFDLVHNNGVALFGIWGARRVAAVHPQARRTLWLAALVAWVMWLDSALNLFENFAFLHVIRTGEPSWVFQVAQAIFAFRSATLIAGFGLALVFHAWATLGARDR